MMKSKDRLGLTHDDKKAAHKRFLRHGVQGLKVEMTKPTPNDVKEEVYRAYNRLKGTSGLRNVKEGGKYSTLLIHM